MITGTSTLLAAVDRLSEALSAAAARRTRRILERRARKLMVRMFRDQRAALHVDVMPIVAQRMFGDSPHRFVPTWLRERILESLNSVSQDYLEPVATVIQDAYDKGASGTKAMVEADPIRDAIRVRAGDRIAMIDETTRDTVRSILERGISNNESYTKVAKDLRKTFDGFGTPSPLKHIRDRAELIAVTEIGQAYIDGQVDAAEDLRANGLDIEKSWLTVGDDRVSEDCRTNESAGWIPWDESFPSGDEAPLAHPGCRCSLLTQRAA